MSLGQGPKARLQSTSIVGNLKIEEGVSPGAECPGPIEPHGFQTVNCHSQEFHAVGDSWLIFNGNTATGGGCLSRLIFIS